MGKDYLDHFTDRMKAKALHISGCLRCGAGQDSRMGCKKPAEGRISFRNLGAAAAAQSIYTCVKPHKLRNF